MFRRSPITTNHTLTSLAVLCLFFSMVFTLTTPTETKPRFHQEGSAFKFYWPAKEERLPPIESLTAPKDRACIKQIRNARDCIDCVKRITNTVSSNLGVTLTQNSMARHIMAQNIQACSDHIYEE